MRNGELPNPKLSLVLGHEIVGSVVEGGERFGTGSPVGVGSYPLRRRKGAPLARRPLGALRMRRRGEAVCASLRELREQLD
ncbi:MAG TPA: hypothetical protein VJ645_01450, partial [Gaiellaceae bacterium]|nr:hypothetical protein [Gaiellaceae bacterium]